MAESVPGYHDDIKAVLEKCDELLTSNAERGEQIIGLLEQILEKIPGPP